MRSRVKQPIRGLRLEALEPRRLLAMGDLITNLADPSTSAQVGAEAGFAVANLGDLVLVGAPGEDYAGASDVGRVHVYDRQTESFLYSLSNPAPAAGDRFGASVAIDSNYIVVGIPEDDPASAKDAGSMAVFDSGTGQLLHLINNPNPSDFAFFGTAVAIENGKIAVGAFLDDQAAMDAGAAYLFDAATGTLETPLISPSGIAFDYFGAEVAMSGGLVAVGAPRTDPGASNAGSVFVFDSSTGAFLREIANPTPANAEYFGDAIGLDGNHLIVGAYRENVGAVNSGAAYVYDVNSGNLLHTLNNPTPALADNFGFSVAIDGDDVIIGAYRDNSGGNDAGTVHQFSASSGNLIRSINNPTPDNFDYFGHGISVNNGTIVAGAYWDDTAVQDAGAVHLFDATNGNTIGAPLFSPSSSAFNYFGHAVATYGDRVVVGAYLEDSGGLDSGVVRVLDAETGQVLQTIQNPTPDDFDNFGYAVAVSNDLLVVGALRDDAIVNDGGAAYIFDINTGSLLHTLNSPIADVQAHFGATVAIAGTQIVVGAPAEDTDGDGVGAAYVFEADTGSLVGRIANPTPDPFDNFGTAVSITDSIVVVSSLFDDTSADDAGLAYVFDAADLTLTSTLIDPFATAGDNIGQAVWAHDNRVFVGGSGRDAGAYDSGVVNVFDAPSGNFLWSLNSPQPADNGFFGSALSGNGEIVVVGAHRELVTGTRGVPPISSTSIRAHSSDAWFTRPRWTLIALAFPLPPATTPSLWVLHWWMARRWIAAKSCCTRHAITRHRSPCQVAPIKRTKAPPSPWMAA